MGGRATRTAGPAPRAAGSVRERASLSDRDRTIDRRRLERWFPAMSMPMKKSFVVIAALLLAACGSRNAESPAAAEHGAPAAEQPAKGPNNGRLLADGPFAIELAIFETGVPPEYHAWP